MRNLRSGCVRIAISSLLLVGCATVPTAGCEWVRPIYPSQKDTLETKRQILQHNLKHEEFCAKYYSLPAPK